MFKGIIIKKISRLFVRPKTVLLFVPRDKNVRMNKKLVRASGQAQCIQSELCS